jgi:hypothetical protein
VKLEADKADDVMYDFFVLSGTRDRTIYVCRSRSILESLVPGGIMKQRRNKEISRNAHKKKWLKDHSS